MDGLVFDMGRRPSNPDRYVTPMNVQEVTMQRLLAGKSIAGPVSPQMSLLGSTEFDMGSGIYAAGDLSLVSRPCIAIVRY